MFGQSPGDILKDIIQTIALVAAIFAAIFVYSLMPDAFQPPWIMALLALGWIGAASMKK
jgi:hypothetical protein